MKKFSFILMGAFLLGTITFALAEETNVEVVVGNTAETTVETTAAVTEATTGDTVEAAATDVTTTEVATGDTAEATVEATETATGDTVEVAEEEAVEATTGDAVENEETAEVAENADTATPTISDAAKEKYGEEQVAAYEWALANGITTINDIEEAKLSDGLTRAQLAKMMSQYMTNVLGKTPVETEKVEYTDVDESLGDLADFIQIAYAYKIMGINADGTPLKNFNPEGQVTRAEYATVFSRVLYGDKYNKSEGNYYEDHLNALKEAGILTNTTPSIQEVRGWVMLMMYRSVNAKADNEESAEQTVGMPNPAAVYCEEQGGTVNIVKDEEGNESGMCKLVDGTEVDEWEYYRANHPEEVTSTEEAAPAEEATEEVAPVEEPTSSESN